jgi:hypothetical protein
MHKGEAFTGIENSEKEHPMLTFVRALTIHMSCHLPLAFAQRNHRENISVQEDDGLEDPWQDERISSVIRQPPSTHGKRMPSFERTAII